MTTKAVRNQSVYDAVIQCYGNRFALAQWMDDNITGDADLSAALQPGSSINYDIELDIANKRVLRDNEGKIFHTHKL